LISLVSVEEQHLLVAGSTAIENACSDIYRPLPAPNRLAERVRISQALLSRLPLNLSPGRIGITAWLATGSAVVASKASAANRCRLTAALTSRSCRTPHSQAQVLSFSLSVPFFIPQCEHSLLDGYQRSTSTICVRTIRISDFPSF
jgi:hypothetical protein